MAQPDTNPVLFIGIVRMMTYGSKGAGTKHYCVARLKDEQTLVGLVPSGDFKEILKRAKGYVKAGVIRKVVFVPPSGKFESPDKTVKFIFEALSRDDLRDAQKFLAS